MLGDFWTKTGISQGGAAEAQQASEQPSVEQQMAMAQALRQQPAAPQQTDHNAQASGMMQQLLGG